MDRMQPALAESRPGARDEHDQVSTTMNLRGPAWRRRWALLAAAAAGWLALGGVAQGTSQGPVAGGPYVGTLPCADCTGIRTTLTLYTLGKGGEPLVYRMTANYVGTAEGDRTEERLGPWTRVADGASERVRLEPHDDARRQTFRRAGPDTLVLLDRDERPIASAHEPTLRRDAGAMAPRLEPPRSLFRGTLSREADRLLLAPCGGGRTLRVHDVSPEVIITAAITDIGFDERDSLYLEAFGRLRDGELWIDRLNRAGIEMGCPQEAIGFRAQGNEPGWSLASDRTSVRFTTQDGAIRNAPPLPLSWRWPGGRPDRAEAVLVTATESSASEAVLAPRICRDTMADAVFGFTATVRVSRPEPSTEFQGCAFLGSEPLPGGW
jgi:copper homeostasis protein (lipoprotein)